jgi:hypothetical protein
VFTFYIIEGDEKNHIDTIMIPVYVEIQVHICPAKRNQIMMLRSIVAREDQSCYNWEKDKHVQPVHFYKEENRIVFSTT